MKKRRNKKLAYQIAVLSLFKLYKDTKIGENKQKEVNYQIANVVLFKLYETHKKPAKQESEQPNCCGSIVQNI